MFLRMAHSGHVLCGAEQDDLYFSAVDAKSRRVFTQRYMAAPRRFPRIGWLRRDPPKQRRVRWSGSTGYAGEGTGRRRVENKPGSCQPDHKYERFRALDVASRRKETYRGRRAEHLRDSTEPENALENLRPSSSWVSAAVDHRFFPGERPASGRSGLKEFPRTCPVPSPVQRSSA